jgi:hypothetical protein
VNAPNGARERLVTPSVGEALLELAQRGREGEVEAGEDLHGGASFVQHSASTLQVSASQVNAASTDGFRYVKFG